MTGIDRKYHSTISRYLLMRMIKWISKVEPMISILRVYDSNANEVQEKEILSEHAYAYDSQAHELMRADRYEERQASRQMMQAVDKALNAAVGEENASYGAKAEKAETHRERISVKDKISEKKDIISKKAAEKSAPSKDHQMGL